MTRKELESVAKSNNFTQKLANKLVKDITSSICAEINVSFDDVQKTILPQAREKAEKLVYELADFINLATINEIYRIKSNKQ